MNNSTNDRAERGEIVAFSDPALVFVVESVAPFGPGHPSRRGDETGATFDAETSNGDPATEE